MLFAALSHLHGKIFRQTAERHSHVKWLDKIRHLEKQTSIGLTLHLIIDNYATHKHPKETVGSSSATRGTSSSMEWNA